MLMDASVIDPDGRDARAARIRSRMPWRAIVVLSALTVLAAIAGTALGYLLRFDLPDVRALEDYSPPVMTRVLTPEGELVHTFAEERRILIEFREIPQVFQDALVSVEDADFHEHTGIDLKGVARAVWRDLQSLRLAEGASTLTQQLARNLFLHPEKTIKRKVQEAILALEIERQYTKEEILRFYANQIYMGHGRYGLEAASRHYFGKTARELTLPEAATLAGLIQRPESLSPIRHPRRALDRRNHVLRRMVQEGFLSPEQAERAQREPLVTAAATGTEDHAPYFIEEVRRWMQERYGSSGVYTEGLDVTTTLDPSLQEIANRAVDRGLRALDKRQGWRGAPGRVPAGEANETWDPGWTVEPTPGAVGRGIVLAADAASATVRWDPYRGTLDRKAVAWTGAERVDRVLKPGDVVWVRAVELAPEGGARFELEQEPIVEGALLALDPRTGAVRALVGGFDFARSEFNRATQARRQTGSAFKPFVYAAALASGWTLADTIVDEPTVFLDSTNPEPYQPENFTNEYYGAITLRTALEKSANISTVKLLDEVGFEPVIRVAHDLGIESDLQPYPSLALGAFETTLLELTRAYAAFANEGVVVEPHLVTEVRRRDGSVVEAVEPSVRDAVSPQIAYLVNQVLRGVITDGTGQAAVDIPLPLAGKTGTTDNYTDAWFIGYSPRLAVGVWVGFDEPKPLGRLETGARAALPIWSDFMTEAAPLLPGDDFPRPHGIHVVPIDRRTGLRADPQAYCSSVAEEVFLAGTEPTERCTVFHHQRQRLPYPFQRYDIGENGELLLPVDDVDALLAADPAVRLVDGGTRLEAWLPQETITMPVRLVTGPPPDERIASEAGGWTGKDGRRARVIRVDRPRELRARR
jgi:penicillin-binding protein 1A